MVTEVVACGEVPRIAIPLDAALTGPARADCGRGEGGRTIVDHHAPRARATGQGDRFDDVRLAVPPVSDTPVEPVPLKVDGVALRVAAPPVTLTAVPFAPPTVRPEATVAVLLMVAEEVGLPTRRPIPLIPSPSPVTLAVMDVPVKDARPVVAE